MKIDRVSEDGITLLVDHFYAKVRVDPVLGPIFERVVRGEWEPHLETMRNFWSSVILTSGRYKGAPVPAHLRIKGIEPPMFDLWLRLFGETCDELFESEVAEAFRAKAVRIAESLKLAVFFRLDRTSGAIVMTYVVTDNCIKCKYMDCVEVCLSIVSTRATTCGHPSRRVHRLRRL